MKKLDVYLQSVRIAKVRPYVRQGDQVLDIGTDDGAMFRKWSGLISLGVGIDPRVEKEIKTGSIQLIRGYFPEALPQDYKFDCITMLAVLEHLPPDVQQDLAQNCAKSLKPKGRVLITVPSPKIDLIIATLQKLRILDATSLDEHYGYDVGKTVDLFTSSGDFVLLRHSHFQLGLNNLFVFEKVEKS